MEPFQAICNQSIDRLIDFVRAFPHVLAFLFLSHSRPFLDHQPNSDAINRFQSIRSICSFSSLSPALAVLFPNFARFFSPHSVRLTHTNARTHVCTHRHAHSHPHPGRQREGGDFFVDPTQPKRRKLGANSAFFIRRRSSLCSSFARSVHSTLGPLPFRTFSPSSDHPLSPSPKSINFISTSALSTLGSVCCLGSPHFCPHPMFSRIPLFLLSIFLIL